MIIGIPAEPAKEETRVAVVPGTAERLAKLQGAELLVQSCIGDYCGYCGFSNEQYTGAGSGIAGNSGEVLSRSDILLRVQPSSREEIHKMKQGAIHISYLDPFNNIELIQAFAAAGVTSISMEMIPRITRAQKMDALSSQASIAGYSAVVLAASRLNRMFPMMITAAGTINPPRVFIIGAGVAGLQAIATAKRLGALVYAFDTRPVVEEQVKSVGARFVKIDLGDTGESEGGYARQLTDEQLERQRKAMADQCAQSDVIITTARVFGKKAPVIINAEIIDRMKPGSLIIDLAIDSGGNVEIASKNEEVTRNGVLVLAPSSIERSVPVHASQMYASNVAALVEEFWDNGSGSFKLNMKDEILKNAVITHDGEIVNPKIRELAEA
jgi:NAD(P) transhydrogenase subunit alpha